MMSHTARYEPSDSKLSRIGQRLSIDRRRLMGVAAGAGISTAASLAAPAMFHRAVAARQDVVDPPPTDHTWLVESPEALLPEDPGAPSDTEIDELLDYQSRRNEESQALVDAWSSRPAVFPWVERARPLIGGTYRPGLYALRAETLIRTAINDAVVTSLHAQQSIGRPGPTATDDRLTSLAPEESLSFPSLHAAVAGAATTVFAYLFPDASDDGFAALADEVVTSRLLAGANFRSDIEAGLALGRSIGELAISRGTEDGSDAEWDGSGWPTGDGYYVTTPPNHAEPFAPLGGTWATWVLPSGDALRPAPFPDYGSVPWHAELAAVQRMLARRTIEQERTIDFWLGIGPIKYFTDFAFDLITRAGLGEAEAASILAIQGVAMYDSLVAVWDGKFAYWIARPISNDPSLNLYVPTPPYPSYPAGFPAGCGSAASVLAGFFPSEAATLLNVAWEGATQRAWSGIHYPLDNEVGMLIGGRTARAVIDHAKAG